MVTVCLFWLLAWSALVRAQETPFAQIPNFDSSNFTHRTNVCERQRLVFEGQVELKDALRGLNLTVAITNYPFPNEDKLFSLDPKSGGIKTEDPGLFVELLDDLALRAGFSWRNSYVAVDPLSGDTDKTWTDLLEWEIDHFDIAADYWGRSAERMALGISFPKGWYDGSIVLAESAAKHGGASDKFNFWSFLDPFDKHVWLAIIGSIVYTGLLYCLLERLNTESDERELEAKPIESIFLASLTFTGHFEYRPNTHAARLMSFSWTFWALIMASAYTANLASFLVSRNVVEFQVSTLEDALKAGTPICIQRYSVMDEVISNRYPDMNIVRKTTEKEIFDSLRDPWYGDAGGCGVALTNLGTFEIYQGNQEVNHDCSLASEKRVVQSLPSGFATAVDTAVYCTSLVSYVLNLHLTEMTSEGVIQEKWRNHLSKISSIDCVERAQANENVEERDSFSLSMKDMGGIFILHAGLCFIALCCAFVTRERKDKSTETSR